MISPVSSVTQAQNVIQTASVSKKSVQPTPQPVATDAVRISSAAQAMQETNETPAQTVQEAGKGDHSAQRLLAREVAERAILEGKG